MSGKGLDMAKKQKTKTDHEIPIPKRGDFFKNLKKAATPEKPKSKATK